MNERIYFSKLKTESFHKSNALVLISDCLLRNRKDLVMIDEDTYKVLGIIQSRYHPSLFKFGNIASKNHGVSLFTLLNRCQSRPGSYYMWKLLRHPTRDVAVLNKRFETIKYFLNPNNQSVTETLTFCLRQVYRLSTNIMNRYSAPQAKASDWSKLAKVIMRLIFSNKTSNFSIIQSVVTTPVKIRIT